MMQASVGTYRAVRLYGGLSRKLPFEPKVFVNYEAELRISEALSKTCFDSGEGGALFLFGYPGNGKRAFAKRLSNVLWEHHKADVLWLDVDALIASRGEPLDEVESVIGERTDRRLLLVVENVDSIRVGVTNNPEVGRFRNLLMDLRGVTRRPMIVLAMARYPERAEAEITALKTFGSESGMLYFDWPDRQRIEQLFKELKLPASREVAKELANLCEGQAIRYTTASLIIGTQLLRRLGSDLLVEPAGGAKRVALAERVATLGHICSPTLQNEVDSYRTANRPYIEQASRDLATFGRRFPACDFATPPGALEQHQRPA